MTRRILEITDDVWNIRGTFRVFGLLDIGTHCTLVRLAPDRFVLLDGLALRGAAAEAVLERTGGGRAVEAIVHLHPFHTVHVAATAALFPGAKLYGTARHHAKFPALRWEPEHTESEAFAARYAADFDFMVPRGVAFVPDNERLHFASVLAFHRASRALHVDDTLMWIPPPFGSRLAFHPTLASVLEPRPEAAGEFRAWGEQLAARCEDVHHVLTAHLRPAPLAAEPPGGIARRVRDALARVEKTLRAHERRTGRGAPASGATS